MSKKMSRRQLRFFVLGMGMFFGLVGWSIHDQGRKGGYLVDDWIPVEGEIVGSEVESVNIKNLKSTGSTFIKGWNPAIVYRYSYKGKEYRGGRYSIMPSARRDYDHVRSVVNSYPVGRKVPVYLNPADPSETVLHRDGEKKSSWILYVAGLILSVIGAMLAVGSFFIRERFAAGGRHR